MRKPWDTAPPGEFRPRRVALVATTGIALTVAIRFVLPAGGYVGAMLLLLTVSVLPIATVRAIQLWRGTLSHTEITAMPTRSTWSGSLASWQAFVPCGVMGANGMCLVVLTAIVFPGGGWVAGLLLLVGVVDALVFAVVGLAVATTGHPRVLLPATMRPGPSSRETA